MRPFSYLTSRSVTVPPDTVTDPFSGYTDVVVSSFDRVIRALPYCFLYTAIPDRRAISGLCDGYAVLKVSDR